MRWNWELANWPHFNYEVDRLFKKERQFLLGVGNAWAFLKNTGESEYHQFIVELLSLEGMDSSKIEGEILERESLQSSIMQHFGLKAIRKEKSNRESRMATFLCNVYETYNEPLTHEMLCGWHLDLFKGQSHSIDCGKYRAHAEPMQIVSRRYDSSKVFFEAPPSIDIPHHMTVFVNWFNSIKESESILGRAAICHIYFESIHPFEDGNGRIGRALVEKILFQSLDRPVLIAVSRVLEKRKKEYYAALEKCNRTLEVGEWVEFFADIILQAQTESMDLLYFLIEKSKILTSFSGQLNPRQEKVLLRIFSEGLSGFRGGLSAENYITIAKTSRATATRDLSDLVQKKILLKTGELRHTRYWLNFQKNQFLR